MRTFAIALIIRDDNLCLFLRAISTAPRHCENDCVDVIGQFVILKPHLFVNNIFKSRVRSSLCK